MRETFRANFLTPIILITLSVCFLFSASYMYNVYLNHQQLRVVQTSDHNVFNIPHVREIIDRGRSKENEIVVIPKTANPFSHDLIARHVQNWQLSVFVNWIYGDKDIKTEYICLLGNKHAVYILPKPEHQQINPSEIVKITQHNQHYEYSRPDDRIGLSISDIGFNNMQWRTIATISKNQLNTKYGSNYDQKLRHQINLHFVDSSDPDAFISPEYNDIVVYEIGKNSDVSY